MACYAFATIPSALLASLLFGCCLAGVIVSWTTLIQRSTPSELLGRAAAAGEALASIPYVAAIGARFGVGDDGRLPGPQPDRCRGFALACVYLTRAPCCARARVHTSARAPEALAGRGEPLASTAMSERTPVAPYMAVGLSTIVHGIARAQAHRAQPRHHRGRDPRRGLDHRHQHAGQADRAGRGRADRVHRRDLRHPARHCGARPLHRHPGPRDRPAGRAGTPLRHLHRRAVQGPLAGGHARPLLQHAVRDLADGEIVHRAAKNHLWCRERSCTPHDVYDRWVELFGDGIEAFYPVLRTDDIGNIGTICCWTASTPRPCGRSPSTAPRSSTGPARPCR